MISESLWNYNRDEIDDIDAIDNPSDVKPTVCNTNIAGERPGRPPQPRNPGDADQPAQTPVPSLNVEVTVPLKYLINFGRSLDLSLINCQVNLDLMWTKGCVLIEQHNSVTGVDFKITITKLYVSVVALSINNNIKFLENIKQGFKRTISSNKYRSEIKTQPKNNNLDYMTDPTFMNINRLFVLSFKMATMILQEITLLRAICH